MLDRVGTHPHAAYNNNNIFPFNYPDEQENHMRQLCQAQNYKEAFKYAYDQGCVTENLLLLIKRARAIYNGYRQQELTGLKKRIRNALKLDG